MSELSPTARALVDAARGAGGPDAAAIARMRGKIDLAITGGAATAAAKLGSTTGSAKAIATGSTVALGTAGKLAVLGALVLAAGAGLLATQRGATPAEVPAFGALDPTARAVDPSSESNRTRATVDSSPEVPRAGHAAGDREPGDEPSGDREPSRVAGHAPSGDRAAPRSGAGGETVPAGGRVPSRHDTGGSSASLRSAVGTVEPSAARITNGARTQPSAIADQGARTATRPTPITLAREVELVDRAMVALTAGDTAGALAAARLHARETGGRGQLAEDATAIEIEALCTLRSPAAARQLAAFDVRWPASAQRARLARACR